MTGEYKHSLDSKGRIFVPARLRDGLGKIFYVTMSMDRCLAVFAEDDWNDFTRRVGEMPYVKQKKMRPVFAGAVKCELDGQGRILIPAALRKYAGLDKEVFVIGCGNHFEVWDAEVWSRVSEEESRPENIAAVMRELEI